MRKTSFLLSFFVPALLAAAPAAAQTAQQATGKYLEINLAGAFNADSDIKDYKKANGSSLDSSIVFNESAVFDGALGYDFGLFRIDGSIGYQKAELDKVHEAGVIYPSPGSISVLTLMGSGYIDIPTSSAIKPFIGAGAGLARLDFSVSGAPVTFTSDDSSTVFAYHFTVGTMYQINPQLSLGMSYRYLGTSEGSFDAFSPSQNISEKMKLGFGSHQIRFGVRFGF